MASRFVYSVQSFLFKEARINPGPLDGILGSQTIAAWNKFLDVVESKPTVPPPPAVPSIPDGNASLKLLEAAKDNVGKLSSHNAEGTEHGNFACAWAVTHVVRLAGFPIEYTLSTDELYDHLKSSSDWKPCSLETPGSIIVSPSTSAMHGHTGIIGENGLIYSNSSARAMWEQNFTLDHWKSYYARCGYYAFAPAATGHKSLPVLPASPDASTPSPAPTLAADGTDFARFSRFLIHSILPSECAYVKGSKERIPEDVTWEDVPGDSGGVTKWGVDQSSHRGVDIKNLSLADAEAIYYKEWEEHKCNLLPTPIAEVVFDTHTTGGHPIVWLQEVLEVTADGVLKPNTLEAAAKSDPLKTANSFLVKRDQYFTSLADSVSHDRQFLAGWLNRDKNLKAYIATLV